MVGQQGKTISVPVQSNSAEPDVFTGTFHPSAGGRYQVLASLSGPAGPLANERTEFLVHGSDLELANAAVRPEQLQAIANLTGGVYCTVENAESLVHKSSIASGESRGWSGPSIGTRPHCFSSFWRQ